MSIQAVIVAGGRGVRMGAATSDVPKPMLPIGGKPLLEHQLLWLKKAGFREAFFCLGYKADVVRSYFGDGSRWGMLLHYQVETAPRGTAGAVRDVSRRLGSDILVVYGDLFIDMDCRRFLDFHSGHDGAASLVLIESDHPLDSDLARVEGDRIMGFYRAKPGEPYENLACGAVWAVRQRLLELVSDNEPSDFGRDIFPKALACGQKLMGYRTRELVADLGTPERRDEFLARWATRP